MNAGVLERENERLRQQNARLLSALEEVRSRLTEPEEVIRAIRLGELDALVVQEQGREEVYSLQRFDSAYRVVVEECFPHGVWLAEPDGRLLYVTPSFLGRLRTSLGEMQAKGQFHFLRPEARESVERAWARCRESGEPFDVEYETTFADGSERTVWTHGILTRTPDGLPRWVGVNIDVTERVRTREQLGRQAEALRDADRRKDEFLATLAHELRNPLVPVRSAVELLRLRGAAEPPLQDMLERQVGHLVRLVDELLDVSRISRGKIDLRRDRVPLAEVVRGAVEAAGPQIEAGKHRLAVAVAPEGLAVEGDAVRLTQVVSNLLSNAAKYTPEGGRIDVTVAREGQVAVIRVRDTGPGIPADMLGRVFDMFTQVNRDSKRSQGGLGIGLTLVRRLAELHGGTAEAFSEGEGKGAEFVVRLPLAGPEGERAAGPAQEETAAVSPCRRILLVEDNADVAESIAMLLSEGGGHEVRTVHDGPGGIEQAAAFRPDLILLDLGMPGMDGYETARKLRELPGGRELVLAALTGWGQEADRRRTREAGFDFHLVKPVGLDALQKLLAGLEEAR
jgi:PAS domain S-box-containing protein